MHEKRLRLTVTGDRTRGGFAASPKPTQAADGRTTTCSGFVSRVLHEFFFTAPVGWSRNIHQVRSLRSRGLIDESVRKKRKENTKNRTEKYAFFLIWRGGCVRKRREMDGGIWWRSRLWSMGILLLAQQVTSFSETCPTYYVNLDHSPDRRERMERFFNTFSELKRVPGVDGHSKTDVLHTLSMKHCPPAQLPRSFDDVNLGVKKGSATYLSRLGCTLSHLRAILRAYDDKREYALILEDDATPDLVPTWPGSLKQYIETLPDDWTIVQLSALSYGDELKNLYTQWQSQRKKEPKSNPTTMTKDAGSLIWSAQAYLISREGMKRIAAKYRHKDGTLDICSVKCIELDDCILHEGVGMQGYRIATPPLFVPRQDMTSTIGQVDSKGGKEVVEKVETRKMYEESRDVLYQWAGSWALSGYKAANLNIDTAVLREVMDAGMQQFEHLKARSFESIFKQFCGNPTNMCSIDKKYLENVDNPQAAAAAAAARSASDTSEAIPSDFFGDTVSLLLKKSKDSTARAYAQHDGEKTTSQKLGTPQGGTSVVRPSSSTSHAHAHDDGVKMNFSANQQLLTQVALLGEVQETPWGVGGGGVGGGRRCMGVGALCASPRVVQLGAAAVVGVIVSICAAFAAHRLHQRRRHASANGSSLLAPAREALKVCGGEVYGAETERNGAV